MTETETKEFWTLVCDCGQHPVFLDEDPEEGAKMAVLFDTKKEALKFSSRVQNARNNKFPRVCKIEMPVIKDRDEQD